ncbi:hypothetical protein BAU15_06465 [Enterococcus sp. JM4C]|uniref:ABC transporter ATP-binding protein n=1 Tax=Candidatus Enterococcus huntleyi TaxID=1857217 RepID=UPI00137B7350|nr:ABC transporter ATP-binding protein [Enterococcus sp. JM4C]KAF1297186.1 hypothetical protein BAU15_06465 [Enterococcus sp. JM4C]
MILEVIGLTKSYGSDLILDDLNWKIQEPQIIALVAPNGTGKTTLLNILTDLESYQEGSIKIGGKQLNDRSLFSELSYMQDNSILYNELTGAEHLQFIAEMYHKTAEDIAQVVEIVGIGGYIHKRVAKYSLGMKQHLLFALGILPNPKLFLLDEPLNGLDPDSVITVRNILKKMHAAGTTIIFSSHNLGEVIKLTETILFLHEGKLKALQDVLRHEEKWSLIIKDTQLIEDFLIAQAISYQVKTTHKIEITSSPQKFEQLKKFIDDNQIEVWNIEKIPWDLEEIYLELFWGLSDDEI